ncbi:hypothetical protein BJR05_18220 [Bacillus cereus]|nr:hypothetical protein [Bacillus cereus]OKA26376.1 hypothetical protein BJR05_18220 [Bacillus cereus]
MKLPYDELLKKVMFLYYVSNGKVTSYKEDIKTYIIKYYFSLLCQSIPKDTEGIINDSLSSV